MSDPIEYQCPRCGDPASAEYYGPCETCRMTLRAQQTGEARTVDTGDYEPKMNFTPNAVALKE
ncbi:MAG: hypothetical protein ACR2QE_20710 [Acidimicrobiales bacterium]